MFEVVTTDEFIEWFDGLDVASNAAVVRAVDLLADVGVRLGHPRSSAIKGSKYAIRELRVQSNGRPLRVFYAFDAARDAVLILGGDKTGKPRFYEEILPTVERVWEQYFAEREAAKRDEAQ